MDEPFAVYKPKGPTSHDILNRIRRLTGVHHVGHAGTLDPLASGVLVVGMGRAATRKLNEVVRKEKEYIADVCLWASSAAYDAEGNIIKHPIERIPMQDEIEVTLQKFVGHILQRPPIYSALKIGGQPAYKRARRGEHVEMAPREVEIYSIRLLSYDYLYLKIQVTTGPGVYIRALARDIGEILGTGAYLAELERIRVGDFRLEQTMQVEDVTQYVETKRQKI